MKIWHLMVGGAQFTAQSTDELIGWIREGRVPRDAMAWTDGMTEWLPIASIPNLAAALAPPPLTIASSSPPPIVRSTGAHGGRTRKITWVPVAIAVGAIVLVGGGYWAWRSHGPQTVQAPPAVVAKESLAPVQQPRAENRGGAEAENRPFPVAVGDEYDVWVEQGRDGPNDPVTHIRGLVVFVPGAKVGENVRIRITKVTSSAAHAEVIGPGSGGDPSLGVQGKPVKIGQILDVEISEVDNRRGDGIVRVEGLVVFVPGTRVGDRVRIRITSVAPRSAIGMVI